MSNLPTMLDPTSLTAELSNIRRMDRLIAIYHGRLEATGGRRWAIAADRGPSTDERAEMEAHRGLLRAALRQGGKSVRKPLADLLGAFPAYGGDARAAASAIASAEEVVGVFPAWAVGEAVARFRNCRPLAPGWNPAKAPTEPQLVLEVRAGMAPVEAELSRLSDVLDAEVYQPMAAEERQRLDAAVKAWADERAMIRAGDAKRETADDLDARLRRSGSLDGLILSDRALNK